MTAPSQTLIFDAHLDLAMNAMEWNRDLRQPLEKIRERDRHYDDEKSDRGRGVVSFSEMRRGRIGLCVATQIARYIKPANRRRGWHSPEQAWAQTQGQLAWYRAMEAEGELVQVHDVEGLEKHLERWDSASSAKLPIGYILSLEGADSIYTLSKLDQSYADGLRAVGPAHFGPGTYAQGTDAAGGLGPRGRDLLREMERLNMILDATHLCDDSFYEALDHFNGAIWASHSNCRALVPHNRQFADEQIRLLIERGAVIGSVFEASMMIPGWQMEKSTPETAGLKLEHIVDHMDHICQIAGNADHCGIGSDLDGAFGTERSPADLTSIASLQNLRDLLAARGYGSSDITKIMHRNFVNFLRRAWQR